MVIIQGGWYKCFISAKLHPCQCIHWCIVKCLQFHCLLIDIIFSNFSLPIYHNQQSLIIIIIIKKFIPSLCSCSCSHGLFRALFSADKCKHLDCILSHRHHNPLFFFNQAYIKVESSNWLAGSYVTKQAAGALSKTGSLPKCFLDNLVSSLFWSDQCFWKVLPVHVGLAVKMWRICSWLWKRLSTLTPKTEPYLQWWFVHLRREWSRAHLCTYSISANQQMLIFIKSSFTNRYILNSIEMLTTSFEWSIFHWFARLSRSCASCPF